MLDEHGRLVGREPNDRMFGQEPGWFSGSIMTFRHFVFRLTRSREYPEPVLGEHHSATPRDEFLEILGRRLHVTRLEDRYPFSPYVLRVRSEAVATFARSLDTKLSGRQGAMYYFAADRNFADIDDVRRSSKMRGASEASATRNSLRTWSSGRRDRAAVDGERE